ARDLHSFPTLRSSDLPVVNHETTLLETACRVIRSKSIAVRTVGRFRAKLDLRILQQNLTVLVVRDESGEDQHGRYHQQLNDNKWYRAPVNIRCGHTLDTLARHLVGVVLFGGHRTQEEQGKTKGRVHEGGLHIDRQQDTEPDQVNAHLVGDRPEQRHNNKGQFKEVQEERQQEG